MKTGILTFHFVNNYGGALQSYALWKTVTDQCLTDAVLIDYRNGFIRFTDAVRLLPISTKPAEWKSGLQTMHLRLKRVQRFRQFMASRCSLSKSYSSSFTLCAKEPYCDQYICGSDQIWNPYLTCGINKAYFLAFTDKYKCSYASSFGVQQFSKAQKRKIKKYLHTFREISVREEEGCRLVMELTKRKAVRLIDPVFLLERSQWDEIAAKPSGISGKYILLYVMQRDERVYQYAEKIKARLGIQIVEISRYGFRPEFIDISVVDAGPQEFVGLLQNAEYVCTNSYHGLAFSLIFEKNFSLIPCKRFATRMSSLLNIFHIKQPDMKDSDKCCDVCYDKAFVKNKIAQERLRALCYLRRNTGGLEE